MSRTAIDCDGFMVVEDFALPDPPYVDGDHYTTCGGCDHCAELEARWFVEQDRLARLDGGGAA